MLEKNRIKINIGLLGVLAIALISNQVVMAQNRVMAGLPSGNFLTKLTAQLSDGGKIDLSGDLSQDSVKLALYQGVPEIYGVELGVEYSRVEQSMNIMKEFDPTYGGKKIKLTGDLLSRYIKIGSKIACEFCCGATALVRQDGEAACGCAHSQAMRGLAAYLLQNHAAEYSDDQILRELARWKGGFFPQAMVDKISRQLSTAQYTPDVVALVMGLKLPTYSRASANAPLPSEIKQLPGQVGGC